LLLQVTLFRKIEAAVSIRNVVYGFIAISYFIFMPLAILLVESPAVMKALPAHLQRYGLSYIGLFFIAGWILYITHALKNERLSGRKKRHWAAGLLFGGFFVMPFYFWWYIRE